MGKPSERLHNLHDKVSIIKEVGNGKLAQDLKSKYKATKSQFSRIAKQTDKLSAVKDSLKNLKPNVELNESLHKWFEDRSNKSDESDYKELLNEKREKPCIDDSSIFKQSKGWISCFKRGKRPHRLITSRGNEYNPSCSVEEYSNEIDLSTNFTDFKTAGNQQQILSKNLIKNVDDFCVWCEQQMDISTQDLKILKKLRDNAKEKLMGTL